MITSSPVSPETIGGAPGGSGNSVLVVDDSAMDRHLAGAIVLKMGGWHAIFAGNGIEALAILDKQPPDVVLTDMLMPEMDGLQLVQAIRGKYPLVPVILMTGSVLSPDWAASHGCAGFLKKPVKVAELLDELRRCAGPR